MEFSLFVCLFVFALMQPSYTYIIQITTGVEFDVRDMLVEDCRIRLQMWDISGHGMWARLSQNYYSKKRRTLISSHCLTL